MARETIKDWRGKIIGFEDTDAAGNKTLRDFSGKVVGKYNKSLDITQEFSGRQVAKGNCVRMLLK